MSNDQGMSTTRVGTSNYIVSDVSMKEGMSINKQVHECCMFVYSMMLRHDIRAKSSEGNSKNLRSANPSDYVFANY